MQLSDLRLADLRPTAVRSFMERRLTMASTPIIRYYDHLRLVYEVQSRMRELRRSTESEGRATARQPAEQQPAPGESKQNPAAQGRRIPRGSSATVGQPGDSDRARDHLERF